MTKTTPRVTFTAGGQGVSANRDGMPGSAPLVRASGTGRGVTTQRGSIPYIARDPSGRGVSAGRPFVTPTLGGHGVSAQREDLAPDIPYMGAAQGVSRPRIRSGVGGQGVQAGRTDLAADIDPNEVIPLTGDKLRPWFYALARRLERVYVLCKDWSTLLSDSVAATTRSSPGDCGIFLDPPYATGGRSNVYAEDSLDIAHRVYEWAISPERNRPDWRICIAGYIGDYPEFPPDWEVVKWRDAQGRMGSTEAAEYDRTEALWFSPSCLRGAEQGRML